MNKAKLIVQGILLELHYVVSEETFNRLVELVNNQLNAQQSVHTAPPSACEDCGSVDEHIHYANCPLANTAGR